MNRYVRAAVSVSSLLTALHAAPAFAADRSGVRPGLLQMPSGPGSIEGLGESFEANPNTGTSSYSVKIAVPPGPGGFVPELALSYSSGGGNTELGVGWALPLPQVQRGTDRGLPRYDDSDELVLKAMGARGAEDLVEMPDGSYRFRIEGAFAKGARRDDGSWRFRAKNGELFRFGASSEARIESGKKVFAWLLTARVDTNGNEIRYEYEKHGGRPYLQQIVYGDLSPEARSVVRFEYEERPDRLTNYLSGFPVALERRLARIVVSRGPSVVRHYELRYDDAGTVSRLSAVELHGRGKDKLPTLGLSYVDFEPDAAEIVAMKRAPARALGVASELDDVNGDGLPDLLVMDESTPGGAYSWYENLDGVSFGAARTMERSPSVWLNESAVELADLDGDNIADVFARISSGSDGLRYYPGGGASGFGGSVVLSGLGGYSPDGTDARLVDLDRDRLVDVLTINEATGRMTVAFNEGAGRFSAPVEVPRVEEGELLSFAAGLRLADMNGDGLQDLALLRSSSLRYWPSLGRGRFGAAVRIQGAPELLGVDEDRAQIRDLNGDGLADVVVVGATEVRYWLSRGGGELSAVHRVTGTPEVRPGVEVRVADMNGNGTADIVWVDPTAASPWRYLDLMPRGTPGLLEEIDNGLGLETRIGYSGMGTLRAWARENGIEWTTRSPLGQTVVTRIETRTGTSPAQVVEYRYASGYFSPSAREFRGFGFVEVRELGDESQPTLVSTHRFLHGELEEAEKGLPFEVERRNEQGQLFDRARTSYEVRVVGAGRGGVPLRIALKRGETRELYELGEEPITLESELDYDDYGNTVFEARYGIVSGQNRATGDDESIVRRTFAVNTELWLLDREASEILENWDGVRIAEKRTYYDGAPFEGLPLGRVERGRATRVESWISGDRFATERAVRYDEHGNVAEVRDARGLRTSVGYDEASRTFMTRETQRIGGVELEWRAAYDEALGVITRVVGPNGEAFEFAYDGLGRVTKIAEPGDTIELPTKAYEYRLGAPTSMIREELRERHGQPGTITKLSYFDGRGRALARIEEGARSGEWVLSEGNVYGARGKERKKPYAAFLRSADLPELASLEGASLTYDALGRSLEQVEADGARTRTEYLPLGKRVYDANDNDSESPHYGTPTTFLSDGLERLVRVVEREGTKELVTGRYSYDAAGKLVAWTDAKGRERRYEYDGRGRRVRIDDPNAGVWSFEYTDGNDMARRVDPTGRALSWTFDEAGRKLTEVGASPEGKEKTLARFHYDEAERGEQEHVRGQLSWVEDQAGEVHLSYTARGILSAQWRRFESGEEYKVSSEFDAQDRLVRRTFPGGSYYEQRYDARGLLSSVGPFAQSAQWNAAGQLTSVEWGNGVREERSYDVRNRLRRLSAKSGDTAIRDLELRYDGASLVRKLVDHRKGVAAELSLSGSFTYDDRYRMVKSEGALGATRWTFDEVGNTLSVASDLEKQYLNIENAFGEDGAGPDALTSFGEERLRYDAAGRVIEDGSRKLSWNAAGKLGRVKKGSVTEEYTYGYADQRVIKKTSGAGEEAEVLYVAPDVEIRNGRLIRYVMFGEERFVRLDPTGEESPKAVAGGGWKDFFQGRRWSPIVVGVLGLLLVAGALAAWRRGRGTGLGVAQLGLAASAALLLTSCGGGEFPISSVPEDAVFWVADHQGTAVALTDAQGRVIEERSHEAYGALRATRGDAEEAYGFVGNEIDRGVGLSDFNARPYRAEAGIFLAPDPMALFEPEKFLAEPSRAWSYAYSSASPVTLSDATGLSPATQFIHEQANRADIPEEQREAAQRGEETNAKVAMFVLEGELAMGGLKLVGKLVGRTPHGKAALQKVKSTLSDAGKKVVGWFSRTESTASLLARSEAAGGHLIAKHVSKTETDLAARLAAEKYLPAASTFTSMAEAEAAIGGVLKAGGARISEWTAAGATGRLKLDAAFSGGSVLMRGASSPTAGSGVRVILQGNGSGGWHVLTGFPTP